ncbi:AMP-binding protein [Specibacter sp. NPDC057265]|uniref:AMP-binding protein n=1 Tax=Specibacter sp. NPDC057265 TaxID=3346075 RepID=UPI003634C5B0
MPFLPELKHWATVSPHVAAVSDGTRSLNYAQLLQAAQEAAASPAAARACGPAGSVQVIEGNSVLELAGQWCAALLTGRMVMVLDPAWPQAVRQALRAAAKAWASEHLGSDGERGPNPRFLLGLSSGTSGMPKGFVRHADSWRESFRQSTRFFGIAPGSVILAPGPQAASMNLYALGESLYAGASFVSMPRFSPAAAVAALHHHGATHLVVVPTLLELVASCGLHTRADTSTLQRIICAGAAVGAPTLEAVRDWVPQAVVQQYYGAAELGFVAASAVGRTAPHAGDPFPGVRWSVRDGSGTALEQGQLGTICVQSPYLCAGYAWGDDGLAFQPLGPGDSPALEAAQPWFTVHDQGWIDSAGSLHLAGRASDMMLVSGANVYPHPIEAVLGAAAAREVVVTGVPDPLRGQRVAAAILAPRTGAQKNSLAACRQAAAALPAVQRPTRWYALTALPATGSGKIDRALLAQWIEQGDSRVRSLQ